MSSSTISLPYRETKQSRSDGNIMDKSEIEILNRDKAISNWLGLEWERNWPNYSYDGCAMCLIIEKLHKAGYVVLLEQGSVAFCSVEHPTTGIKLAHSASSFLPHVLAEVIYTLIISEKI